MEKTVPTLATTMLSRYDAVLLDIDGTLVDSNGAHASAWSDAFKAYGRHHPPEQVRPLIGKGGDKLLRELASLDAESGEGKRIAEARVEIFRDRYLPNLKPTPGAAAFVEWLLESRMTVVVATSAKEDEVKALLRICGGQALVKDATTSDDAERSKPDPDILVAALEKSGATPERAIMIGDTPYDIEAASRAGLATIAFRCGGWDDATLQGAIAIYDHPRQLMDCLGQSPHVAGSHLDNATEGAIRMARLPNSTTRGGGPLLGALGALGLTLAIVALRRPNRRQSDETGDKRKTLATYPRRHQTVHDCRLPRHDAVRPTERLRRGDRCVAPSYGSTGHGPERMGVQRRSEPLPAGRVRVPSSIVRKRPTPLYLPSLCAQLYSPALVVRISLNSFLKFPGRHQPANSPK
jgi:HAD superfamily hydrolase (TIGR01509 family)